MKMSIPLKIFLVMPIVIAIFSFNLFAMSARDIIETSERALQGDTQVAIAEIMVKTRRWTRTMEMTSYTNRIEKKTFAEITAPKKDAGNRFLLLGQRMWHYVPKLQQTIKISPSMMLQSWMGSDFTNDDIVKESSILTDYTHSIIGKDRINGYDCYKIELLPKPDAAVVWGKIIYYARINDYLPVRQDYYNERNLLKKFMTYSNFIHMHDRIIPTHYKMQTVKKKDQHTVMKIKMAKFDLSIPDKHFSLQHLKRK